MQDRGHNGSSPSADLVTLALCGLSACSEPQTCDSDGAVCIVGVLQSQSTTPYEDPPGPRLTEGLLDVTVADGYMIRPIIQARNVFDPPIGSHYEEAPAVRVDGYVIVVHGDSPQGPTLIPPGTVYETIIIPPQRLGAPSYGEPSVGVIVRDGIERLRTSLCAPLPESATPDCPVPQWPTVEPRIWIEVRGFGTGPDLRAFDMPPYVFPVRVCCHCLVTFPAESVDPSHPGPNCLAPPPREFSEPAFPGQDGPLDCRVCARTNPAICEPRGFSDTAAPGVCPP